MHIYQLRTYTLDSEASADAYEEVWRRHLSSLPQSGIWAYGVWRPVDRRDQLVALVSVPEHDDHDAATRRYMSSKGFQEDFADFKGQVLGVEAVAMTPIAASPMR